MNNREMYFKGRLAVASIAVLLALAATALKRDDSRRKAAAGSTGTIAAERGAGKTWWPMSYDPVTGLVYIPAYDVRKERTRDLKMHMAILRAELALVDCDKSTLSANCIDRGPPC